MHQFYFILMITLGEKENYYIHFTDEEIEALERLNNLPKVTQIINSSVRIQILAY